MGKVISQRRTETSAPRLICVATTARAAPPRKASIEPSRLVFELLVIDAVQRKQLFSGALPPAADASSSQQHRLRIRTTESSEQSFLSSLMP